MKVPFGMALRQTTGVVEGLMQLVGLGRAQPGFSTPSRRHKARKVNIPFLGWKGPLHLSIDSTGIKIEPEGEWHARKHGSVKWRLRRKIQIGVYRQTLEIRAADFTTSDIGDAPLLPEWPNGIPPDPKIGSVTADGAFHIRKCHKALAVRGAAAFGHSLEAMAFVPSFPPRKDAKPRNPDTAGAAARHEALRASWRFDRTIWRRW
jgi:hypothetical protein